MALQPVFVIFLLCAFYWTSILRVRKRRGTYLLFAAIILSNITLVIYEADLNIIFGVFIAHWDFLQKFLSSHYYTTLEGVLGVQRSGQAQGTISCFFGPLFFSQNGITWKKLKKLPISSEKILFFGILSEFVQFWLENSGPNQLVELKWIIMLLLKPKPSLDGIIMEISCFFFLFQISDLWRHLAFFHYF